MTHICVGNLTIIGSDNGLSPGRRQAIIWTNAGILLIWHLRTNFSEILIEIGTFSYTKMHLKMSSGKWRPFCLGLNVLTRSQPYNKKLVAMKTCMHYDDVIMTMLASQITSLTVVYSIVYSGVNQRKHQSSASLAFVREIHRGPVNFPHKWPVTRKMFPFDDVIMDIRDMLHSSTPKQCCKDLFAKSYLVSWVLTDWCRVTHICVSKLTIIASDNGLSRAIIWTNAGILLIGPWGRNFSEIVIVI